MLAGAASAAGSAAHLFVVTSRGGSMAVLNSRFANNSAIDQGFGSRSRGTLVIQHGIDAWTVDQVRFCSFERNCERFSRVLHGVFDFSPLSRRRVSRRDHVDVTRLVD